MTEQVLADNNRHEQEIRRIVKEEVSVALSHLRAEINANFESLREEVQRLNALFNCDGAIPPESPPLSTNSFKYQQLSDESGSISDRSEDSIGSSPRKYLPVVLNRVSSRVRQRFRTHFASPTSALSGPLTIRRNSGISKLTSEPIAEIVIVPEALKHGVLCLRIAHNKRVRRVLRIDEEQGLLTWNTKQSSRLLIDRICEIYVGENARNYREEFKVSADLAARWATIIYQHPGNKVRFLHIVAAVQIEFDMLMSCLVRLVAYRREIMSGLAHAGRHFVNVHWSRLSGNTRRLSFEQVEKLTRRIHINCAKEYIRQVFDEADVDSSGYLDFAEFKRFVRLLKRRADIAKIFECLAPTGVLTLEQLRCFIEHVQKQSISESTLNRLYAHFANTQTGEIAESQFTELIASSTFLPTADLDQDLDRPLNEYFISSSHNTYLMGRQVGDKSSVEAYIRALQDGCRCLEIDIWDGPNGPIVCHGHQLTRLSSAIQLDNVLSAILKYGFISSPYPIILSLEIRCNEANQLQVVRLLKTIFGDLLVTKGNSISVPSPNNLKHSILIKVKSAPETDCYSSDGSLTSDDSSTRSRTRIIPEMEELAVFLKGVKYSGPSSLDVRQGDHCLSLSERAFRQIMNDAGSLDSLERHNREFLCRVYPSAFRITSSNFNPMIFWRKGVQLVALNWQRNDAGMQLNRAFFCPHVGYVLKPAWMRQNGSTDAPKGSVDVTINIISAQQLPRPRDLLDDDPLSPYVSVRVLGIEAELQWKTQSCANNGFNPIWNFERKTSISYADYEFACLQFSVGTGDTEFAFYTARLSTMLNGYRHLPLQDIQGEDYIFSTLFIRLDVEGAEANTSIEDVPGSLILKSRLRFRDEAG